MYAKNNSSRHLLTPLVWHMLDVAMDVDRSMTPAIWAAGQDDLDTW